MKKILRYLYLISLIGTFLLAPVRSFATHFFGVDLNYTNVSGNTYAITLTVWGDCSGAAFPNLQASAPIIGIYNGNSHIQDITLTLQAPTSGVEVTPVCPSQAGNTTCTNVNNPIPGIKKFVYTGNVTLSGTSSVWRFLFSGNMGGAIIGNQAGRSNSITNIVSGTNISLVDTLNNTTAVNSSPALTTIPTPFFCDNVPSSYNPGAVDPNNDSLTFYLVPGIDALTGSSVNYVSPATATAPLAASPFTFSSFTGQLNFTPNALQKSLVVYNIEERRNGVLVGTCQREMTFVVLNCSNIPPSGGITNASAGTIIDSTDFSICQSVGPFSFQINPTDPNGDHITMSASGLPSGANFTITGNGTTSPLGTFTWNTIGVTPDVYIFYITFQDDACPLSGKQTTAYTITILPSPTISWSLISPATCVRRALFNVIPGNGTQWNVNVLQGGNTVQTFTNVTGSFVDSLFPGTYTLHATLANSCSKDTTIVIASPPQIYPVVTMIPPTCVGGHDGSITVTGGNGLAPYQYAFGVGAYSGTNTFTNLATGPYILHVKDANGCTKDTTVLLPDGNPVLANIVIKKPSCNNYANGSITITGYNNVAPYQYALGAGTFSATNVFSNLAPGTYILHVKSSAGCTKDTSVTLTDSTEIHATLTINNNLCYGDSSASVTVNATGAYLLPYKYALNAQPFVYTNTYTGLTAGSYTIHIKDSALCYLDTTFTVTQPAAVLPSHVVTNVGCYGTATGIITMSATGGTPAYLYNINGGAYTNNGVFSNLAAGTYIIGIKDSHNCQKKDTVVVTQPPLLNLDSVNVQQILCHGNTNGGFTIYGSGGTPPYTFAYNGANFQAGNIFSGLGPGVYTLDLIDANGCVQDTVIVLTDPAPTLVNLTLQRPSCNNFSNGAITANAYNSQAPYTYALDAGAFGNNNVFTGLPSGTHTIHIKNANGCALDTAVTLTDSTTIHATLQLFNVLCNGGNSGYVVVSATGAYLLPYMYAANANPFGYNDTLANLTAGTYTIHVRDSELCHFDTVITITQPTPITITPTITNELCNGASTGAITVAASGGTPSYQYNINGGTFSNTNSFPNLPAGSYIVQVQDANNCLKADTIPVTQPTQLLYANIVFQQPNCNGDANGTITITPSGGATPYTYAINGNAYQAANNFTGLTAGTYTLHIKDANNCTHDSVVTLSQPTPVSVSAAVQNATCLTLGNGSVTLTGGGGTSPYTYAVGGGAYSGTATFSPLASGTYTFHVKDTHGCIKDTTITITDSLHITASLAPSPALCYGQASGQLTIAPSGGTGPYLFAVGVNPYSNTNPLIDLSAGSYILHVKDQNGCIFDTTFNITQPTNILPQATVSNVLCHSGTTGSINISVTGGTPAYLYTIGSGGAYTNNTVFNNLPAGTDTIYIQDANGCLRDTVLTITQPAALVIDSIPVLNVKCYGDSTGTITVFAHGGTSPFQYQQNALTYQSSNVFTNIPAGSYLLNVKDANGCVVDSNITVTQAPPLNITALTIVSPTCPSYPDGAAAIHANGGTLPYTYSVDNSTYSSNDSFSHLTAGGYVLYVKDSNNCIKDTALTLTGYPQIVLDSALIKEPSCYGYTNGQLNIIAIGGVPPFTYLVNSYPLQDSGIYTGLAANTYSVTITDSKNCKLDTAFKMGQPDSITVTSAITPNDCQGTDNQGAVALTVSGGTTPYSFLWNTNPIQTGQDITGVANGNYLARITDANSCADSILSVVDYDNCCTPYLPNAFTPNGDGKDDIYRLVFKGDIKLIEFSVYNRFGQRVYTTDVPGEGWDGKYNGVPQNMDTYFYYVRFICGNSSGNPHKVVLKGDVTLIR